MKDEIKQMWIQLVGEDLFPKLKLDKDGYSDWRCRSLMPSHKWTLLDSKFKPYKGLEPSGADLLYIPKIITSQTTQHGVTKAGYHKPIL